MRIRVVPASEFGSAAAEEFLAAMALHKSPFYGISTGATMIPLYETLKTLVEHNRARIDKIYPVAVNEYAGPRDHPASNHSYFKQHWMSIPGAHSVFEFDTRVIDPEIEARRMEDLVWTLHGLSTAVLGIGANGHLAFNEPGSQRRAATRLTDLAPETRAAAGRAGWGDDAPHRGLTLGLNLLLEATRVILLANGAAKAGIVAQAVSGPVTADVPASYLQEHADLVVVLDEAAASALPAELTAPGEPPATE